MVEELKINIMNAALEEFNEKGAKFTMECIAKRLGISKKTIYAVFKDKHDLMEQTVTYGFCMVKESENRIYKNEQMSLQEKIKKILIVMPDQFMKIDFRKLHTLKESYPDIFNQIQEYVNTGWEATIDLLSKGIEKGIVKKTNLLVFQSLFEAGIMKFLSDDTLIDSGISYDEALEEMVNIMMNGIII